MAWLEQNPGTKCCWNKILAWLEQNPGTKFGEEQILACLEQNFFMLEQNPEQNPEQNLGTKSESGTLYRVLLCFVHIQKFCSPIGSPICSPNWDAYFVRPDTLGQTNPMEHSKFGGIGVILVVSYEVSEAYWFPVGVGSWPSGLQDWMCWANIGPQFGDLGARFAPSFEILGPFWLQVGGSWGHIGCKL